jgi:transcriptional regulator of acetoin/glycerol metabolism
MELLTRQLWPGNIREIENLAKYLLTVTEGDIEAADLPPPYNAEPKKGQGIPTAPPPDEVDIFPSSPPPHPGTGASMEAVERDYILSVLEMTKWNVTAAARHAGIKRTTFNSRMKKHGISKKS